MPDPTLMDYFKFDESDLQANRNDQISEKQKQRILKKARSRLFANPFSRFGYKLARAQGPIKFENVQTAYHGGELWTYLDVDEKSFRVDQDLTNIMKQGEVFCIYYCFAEDAADDNGLYEILSAELISKAK